MGDDVGIYLRISDDREGRELGVQRQDDDCHTLAKRRGDRVVDTYKDNDIGASTRSRKPRPEYKRLLADARAGRIKTIIAYTSGRLTRRPREHEDQIELAEKYGIQFVYVASPSFDLNTSAGRLIARILAAKDAGEAEDIGERVSRSKAQMMANGLPIGGPRPFGFKNGAIEHEPREAAALADAIHRVLAGDSMRSIYAQWNKDGLLTSTGERWDGTRFKHVLERPRNAGLVGTRKSKPARIVGPAVWKPIVDRETWEAFIALIDDPARAVNSGHTSLKLLGSFLFRCECGQYVKSGGNAANGKPRYTCLTNGDMRRLAAPADDVVHAVVEGLLVEQGMALVQPTEDLTPLRDRLTLLRAKAMEIASEFADPDSDMTREQFKTSNASLQAKIRAIESRFERAIAGTALSGIADAADPVAAWRTKGIDRQRRAIDSLMTVTLLRVPRGRHPGGFYFDAESVRIDPKTPGA